MNRLRPKPVDPYRGDPHLRAVVHNSCTITELTPDALQFIKWITGLKTIDQIRYTLHYYDPPDWRNAHLRD